MKKINLLNLLKLSSLLMIAPISLVSCDSSNEDPITEVEQTEQFLSNRVLLLDDGSGFSSILSAIFFGDGGVSYNGSSFLVGTSGTSTYSQTGNLGILQLDDDTLGIVTISLTFDDISTSFDEIGQYEATSSTITETGTFQLSATIDPFSDEEIASFEEQYIGLTEDEAFELAEADGQFQGIRVKVLK